MRIYDEGGQASLFAPRWFCWENVPGVFSSGFPKGEDFRFVLEQIAGNCRQFHTFHSTSPLGLATCWEITSGSCILPGVEGLRRSILARTPQRRRRVFLVADFAGQSAPKILFDQESLPGHSAQGEERGKPLPPQLHAALLVQAGLAAWDECGLADTRDITAGFSAGAGASAGSIGYSERAAPTLKAGQSGNRMPSVLCLNDQGGSVMDCTEDKTGTLRAQQHGHQPLVFENHGIDSRYTGPHPIVPTLSARAGTGGNNLPLALQPEPTMCICGNAIDRQPRNGGNGIGIQNDVAYTLTSVDRHAIFRRQRVDKFREDDTASTQSARQGKDATDLICQPSRDTLAVFLIRRLTPLECERLPGVPGWVDRPARRLGLRPVQGLG